MCELSCERVEIVRKVDGGPHSRIMASEHRCIPVRRTLFLVGGEGCAHPMACGYVGSARLPLMIEYGTSRRTRLGLVRVRGVPRPSTAPGNISERCSTVSFVCVVTPGEQDCLVGHVGDPGSSSGSDI